MTVVPILMSKLQDLIEELERQGKTLLLVAREGTLIGIVAAADTLRPEVRGAVEQLRAQGISTIKLLTGDHRWTAEALASAIGVTYRAELLPEDKIRIVKQAQERGAYHLMRASSIWASC